MLRRRYSQTPGLPIRTAAPLQPGKRQWWEPLHAAAALKTLHESGVWEYSFRMETTNTSGPASTFGMAAFNRAKAIVDAIPKPTPMTVVTNEHMMPGKAWQMLDDGHLYAFIHPSDLSAIPTVAASTLGYAGVPVRSFDEPEMREVFLRGLERTVEAEDAAL